jgi:outer membrane protein OmpA-like peptidoglycan-associated protein
MHSLESRAKGVDMRTRWIAAATAAVFAVSGCANMTETQRDTATGAAIGTAAGAAIGAIAGGGKGAAIGAGIGAAAGAGGGYIWSKRMQEQKRAMEEATRGTGVTVTQTPNNELKLDIPSDISFDTGKSQIKPQMRPVLDKCAYGLNGNPATVRIIGYTDSTGTDAINNPLSVNRAASTRDYLASRGVDPNRIAIDGRGARDPIADNRTPEGRAKNRRVEVFVAESSAPAASSQQPSRRN